MSFHATTTVDIYRGETVDSYGDPADTDAPLHTALPASIIERSKTIRNQDTRTSEVVRVYTGRMYASAEVQNEDRIRDRNTGIYYVIDGIAQPANPAATADLQLDLRRLT
jgi:hypothetical protein